MSNKNEEKAHTMLNRWVAIKKELNSRSKEKRPKNPEECPNLQDCERWRNQIIKEITKKVADIQNASLGEFKIRELNDEINKFFKEKSDWEKRIKDLGGPDYIKLAPKTFDAEGYEVPNSGGYKYWGAAKDLPGVRELFAIEAPSAPKRNLTEVYRNIDREYYGGCFEEGEEEQILLEERKEEERLMKLYNEEKLNQEILDDEKRESPKKRRKIDNDNFLEIDKERIELEQFEAAHNFMVGKAGELWEYSNENESKDIETENEIIKKKKEELIEMLQNE